MKVDDGFLQVVGTVVEKGEHGGPDEIWSTLGQCSSIYRLDQDLQTFHGLLVITAKCRHPQPQHVGQLAEQQGHGLLLHDGCHASCGSGCGGGSEVTLLMVEVFLNDWQYHFAEELDGVVGFSEAVPSGEIVRWSQQFHAWHGGIEVPDELFQQIIGEPVFGISFGSAFTLAFSSALGQVVTKILNVFQQFLASLPILDLFFLGQEIIGDNGQVNGSATGTLHFNFLLQGLNVMTIFGQSFSKIDHFLGQSQSRQVRWIWPVILNVATLRRGLLSFGTRIRALNTPAKSNQGGKCASDRLTISFLFVVVQHGVWFEPGMGFRILVSLVSVSPVSFLLFLSPSVMILLRKLLNQSVHLIVQLSL